MPSGGRKGRARARQERMNSPLERHEVHLRGLHGGPWRGKASSEAVEAPFRERKRAVTGLAAFGAVALDGFSNGFVVSRPCCHTEGAHSRNLNAHRPLRRDRRIWSRPGTIPPVRAGPASNAAHGPVRCTPATRFFGRRHPARDGSSRRRPQNDSTGGKNGSRPTCKRLQPLWTGAGHGLTRSPGFPILLDTTRGGAAW
jgi:hypothetical protein